MHKNIPILLPVILTVILPTIILKTDAHNITNDTTNNICKTPVMILPSIVYKNNWKGYYKNTLKYTRNITHINIHKIKIDYTCNDNSLIPASILAIILTIMSKNSSVMATGIVHTIISKENPIAYPNSTHVTLKIIGMTSQHYP